MQIVLVDASRTVSKIVTQLLQARGYLVLSFADGPEAISHIKSGAEVDALITSVELPSMSGFELCWEVRLLADRHKPIHIIMMSSTYDRGKLAEALDSGADDFIGKPPAPEELYARLRAAERLVCMQRELIRMATTDPMTTLMNRRALFERGQQVVAGAAPQAPVSSIIFDIDQFKRINDIFGHDVGDRAICSVAAAAADEAAIVGRLGGEEFAILLENRSIEPAFQTAEKLRARVAGLRIPIRDGTLTLTCSFGVSEWQPGDTLDHLLKRADVALYQAKRNGRNRVVRYGGDLLDAPAQLEGSILRSAS